jgi:hypothetical protein
MTRKSTSKLNSVEAIPLAALDPNPKQAGRQPAARLAFDSLNSEPKLRKPA